MRKILIVILILLLLNQSNNGVSAATQEFSGTGDEEIRVDLTSAPATLIEWTSVRENDNDPNWFDMYYYYCLPDPLENDEIYCDGGVSIFGEYGYSYLYNTDSPTYYSIDVSTNGDFSWTLTASDSKLMKIHNNELQGGSTDQTIKTALFDCDSDCTIYWESEFKPDFSIAANGLSVGINEYDYKSFFGETQVAYFGSNWANQEETGIYEFNKTGRFYFTIETDDLLWWTIQIDRSGDPESVERIEPQKTDVHDEVPVSSKDDLNLSLIFVPTIVIMVIIVKKTN